MMSKDGEIKLEGYKYRGLKVECPNCGETHTQHVRIEFDQDIEIDPQPEAEGRI